MDGFLPRRSHRCLFWCVPPLVLLFAGPASLARAADPQMNPLAAAALVTRSMYDDAELRDVCFLDTANGYAVGDRGVIWHTADGGGSWRLQNSGTDASLVSLDFRDSENGFAAGRLYRAYQRSTTGVLLRTVDGGQTWEHQKGIPLPALRKVKFFGPAQGWLIADSSDIFPSGIFCTDSGGRAWTPLTDREITDWTVADFASPAAGATAGSRGARGVVRERILSRHEQPELGLREPRALRLSSALEGWCVGDCGLVQATRDGGRTWQPPPQDPSGAAHFDFRAVEVRGQHVWMAGIPGSRVFHSPDGGTTWESTATGQNLPLNAITFVDEQHGWAVGALGTIIATRDGGRTWNRQRGPRTRAAMLAIYSDTERVPLEAVARVAANDGCVTIVELVGRRDAEADTPTASGVTERERAALVGLGCSSVDRAWGFPLRQKGIQLDVEQIAAGWDRMYGGRGVERLQEHLVRTIRAWRPDIVLTSAASPGGDDPLGHLINQVVLRAVADAADARHGEEQIAVTGLTPWTVKKVAGGVPSSKLGSINLNAAQLAPRLGMSLGDYASRARGLLDELDETPPASWSFRLYLDHVPQGLGQQDFLSGLPLEPGGDARREVPAAPRAGIEQMRQVAEKHRNLQAILNHAERTGRGGAVLMGQIGELTRGLDPDTAGQALFELAHAYYTKGEWDLAAGTFEYLLEKQPQHRLTPPALTWLIQYYASGEAACRALPRAGLVTEGVAASRPPARPSGVIPAAAQLPIDPPQSIPLNGGQRDVAGEPTTLAGRRTKAAAYGAALERLDPVGWSEMHTQFPLAVARDTASRHEADRFFTTLVGTRPQDAWWACARTELWFCTGVNEAPPKPTVRLPGAAARPRLDGDLSDDTWAAAERLELRSAQANDADWPSIVLLARDDQFLYVGIDCRFAAEANYPDEQRTRERDADLSHNDRVEVLIDVDRDFTTFYRLGVDYRGWTAEECWRDRSWNPRWFVAAARNEDGWTVEAAIPLAELACDPPAQQSAWALGVQRIVPGVGFQTWARPATVAGVPQGLGLLIFD